MDNHQSENEFLSHLDNFINWIQFIVNVINKQKNLGEEKFINHF